MPARPGAFTANFAPETLNEFREKCKRSGLQYTKVLEELANLYLESDGMILYHMNIWERLLMASENHQNIIKDIVKFLNSKQSFDVATKNELAEVINSSWKIHPIAAINTEQQEFLKEIESKTESRVDQLHDSSIDRASPPDELTKWEEGYSDLFEKLKISEQKLFKKIRDAEQTSFRESLNLKIKVAKLEEQLASLQAKIID